MTFGAQTAVRVGVARADVGSVRGDFQAAKERTPLLVSVELPGFGLHEVFRFDLRPLSADESGRVFDRLGELVEDIGESLGENVLTVDSACTIAKLEQLRAAAMDSLDLWRERLKISEDMLIRVDGAKQQMNTMREMYYKEISMLREQLHKKTEAERARQSFVPENLCLFDPSEFVFDDDSDFVWLLRQKAEVLQKRYESHVARNRERLDDVESMLKTKLVLLQRKDALLRSLLQKHGYASEWQLEQALAKQAAGAEPEAAKSPTPATDVERRASQVGNGRIEC